MKNAFFATIGLIIFLMNINLKSYSQLKIGIFADCQYCNCEPAGSRYYNNSIQKLTECISDFNNNKNIKFIVNLGDLIDRDFESFERINSVLLTSQNKVFHVTGNHDFSVENKYYDQIPEQLNLTKTYYSIHKKGWQFIFLDGNEITFQSNNPEIVKLAEKKIEQLTKAKKSNNQIWNGGMSEIQIKWMEKELQKAERKNRKVVLFCHFPLLPFGIHSLWNAEEIQPILEKYSCVKAWINGHNHAGETISQKGIHYITMQGMVETKEENAYSIISFSDKRIEIEGFGREKSKSLKVR